jgi:serine/threonine protein kinase
VAVKIVNIDDMDFSADPRDRDETVRDFRKEVGILQQLKDSGARNVNLIHDAFDLHSQLWIVSDYCTGGSVRTLMRANPAPPLEEHYIIPIARELAVAMKCVHDIGVIHRDIKCTNVYVTEDGKIQLGDFGIVGVMDDGASKRTTIVGTPWYMPREMHVEANSVAQGYGTEVDIWSYGCTVYEMATGQVPNANVHMHMLNSVLENAPRLAGGDYSEGLRDFVAFCLNNDPKARPTAEEILQHPFIADTEQTHPTNNLIALIERYAMWEFKGGQRASLFNPGGAAAPVSADEIEDDQGNDFDWNFSLSERYTQGFTRRISQMYPEGLEGLLQDTPIGSGLPQLQTKNLTVFEQIQKEHKEKSATRGEMSLDRLFNPESVPYAMHAAPVVPESPPEIVSDLPLRDPADGNSMRESTIMIDLDAEPDYTSEPVFNFNFDDLPTVKARAKHSFADDDDDDEKEEEEEDDYQYGQYNDDKRATKDWAFPGRSAAAPAATAATVPKRATMDWSFANAQPAKGDSADTAMNLPSSDDSSDTAPGFRPQLLHTTTVPLGQFGDYLHNNQPVTTMAPSADVVSRDSMSSMIDLDLAFSGEADLPPRPSTASSASGSTGTERTSGDPFDLEDNHGLLGADRNRFSYHKQWQSDGGPADSNRSSLRNVPMHARGSSLSSTASELDRNNVQVPLAAEDVFAYDYEDDLNTTTRKPLQLKISHPNEMGPSTAPLNSQIDWPDFNRDYTNTDSPGYAAHSVPQLGDPSFPLSGHDHMNGTSAAMPRSLSISQPHNTINGGSFGTPGGSRDTLEFPNVVPPNPAALDEDASAATLAAELDRLFDDFRGVIKSTGRGLRQRTGLNDEVASFSDGGFSSSLEEETDTGFESTSSMGFRSGVETGDEEGF